MITLALQDPDTPRESGNGWQKPAMAGLWAVVLLFAGWMWNTNASALKDASDQQQKLAAEISASQQRIATLEEALRGLSRSMDRIEDGVNELRRERLR